MGTEISPVKRRKPHGGFLTLLSSAACEWFLIFLLFLDAALSYIVVKFAHYCDLKEPCPLCSRFDHIFRRNKPRSFYTLLCNNHREEVSSSVPCSVHGNFADINSLCEDCLVPSAMEWKSSSESYRLLAGKLWVDVEHSVFQHLVMNKYIHLGSSIRKTCLCCNKTWRTKSNAERLLEFTPVALGASKANVKPPLPRVPGRSRFSRRDSLKRLKGKIAGPMKPVPSVASSTLAHVGYTKLKIASDSESEFPFSEDDDDDANTVCSSRSVKSVKSHRNGELDIQFSNRGIPKGPMVNNAVLEKKTSQGLEAKHASVDQPNLLDLSVHKSDSSSKSDMFVEHGLRELNWAEYYKKPAKSLTTEVILLDEGHPPSNGGGNVGPSVEESTSTVSFPHISALSVLSELLSIGPSFSNAMMVPAMTNNIELPSENGNAATIEHTEAVHSDNTSLSKQDTTNSADSSENLKLSNNDEIEHVIIDDSAKIDEEEETKSLPRVIPIDVAVQSKDDHSKLTAHEKEEVMTHENEEESMKDNDVPVPSKDDHSKLTAHENEEVMTHEKEEESMKENDVSVTSKDNHSKLIAHEREELRIHGNEELKIQEKEEESKKDNDVTVPSKDDHSKLTAHEELRIRGREELKTHENEEESMIDYDVNVPSNDDHSKLTAREEQRIHGKEELKTREKEKEPMKDNDAHENEELRIHWKEELKTHEKEEESMKNNDFSSEVVQVPDSLPRNFSLESLDGIIVGDIEGESLVDRLKRQLISLYKELEEERNAAAIAANEAMAMITRLQEEKAALHMEALQYLRMMEEQAEYDMEALEKSNDLLAEKEKELEDLEAELEFYRENLLDESGVPDLPKDCSNAKSNSAAFTQNKSGTFGKSKVNEMPLGNGHGVPMNSTIRNFHDEKAQMLQHLRNLEEKLRQSYCGGKLDEITSKTKDQVDGEQFHIIISSSNGKTESNGSYAHDEENGCLYEKSEKMSESRSETSSVILEEIAELHGKLEALETR